MTGTDLNKLDEAGMREAAATTNVFARVSPEHKVGIVQAIKDNGGIVAMTGDGVNDAPALKRADIGVAMGITGTDVTKETADMVVTDDNFASIVAAVEEGRVIYSNIRKFVFFLLSCNMGEILIIFIAMLLGWPIPLLPIHLLWVNLITDAFPALALGMEKKEPNIMEMPPRNPDEPIIDKTMRTSIIIQSSVLTFAVLASFYFGLSKYDSVEIARTYAFVTLVVSELFRAFTTRSEKYSVLKIGILSNRSMNIAILVSLALLFTVMTVPALEELFNLEPFNLADWETVLAFSLLPFFSGELSKKLKGSAK
jgi:Ca2+-transporting ATPase